MIEQETLHGILNDFKQFCIQKSIQYKLDINIHDQMFHSTPEKNNVMFTMEFAGYDELDRPMRDEVVQFLAFCEQHELDKYDLYKQVYFDDKPYTIVGWNNRREDKVILQDERYQRIYVTPKQIKDKLTVKFLQFPETPYNKDMKNTFTIQSTGIPVPNTQEWLNSFHKEKKNE